MPPRRTTRRKKETREEILHIRLTDAERKQLEARAKAEHLDMSVWARAAILKELNRPELGDQR